MTDPAPIEELPLAADFPAVGAAQWRALVEKVLKGADIERRLVRTTADGIKVQPLYVAADAPVASGHARQRPLCPRCVGGRVASQAAGTSASSRPSEDPARANAAILEAWRAAPPRSSCASRRGQTSRLLDRVLADVLLDLASSRSRRERPSSWPRPRRCCDLAARRGIDAATRCAPT